MCKRKEVCSLTSRKSGILREYNQRTNIIIFQQTIANIVEHCGGIISQFSENSQAKIVICNI